MFFIWFRCNQKRLYLIASNLVRNASPTLDNTDDYASQQRNQIQVMNCYFSFCYTIWWFPRAPFTADFIEIQKLEIPNWGMERSRTRDSVSQLDTTKENPFSQPPRRMEIWFFFVLLFLASVAIFSSNPIFILPLVRWFSMCKKITKSQSKSY